MSDQPSGINRRDFMHRAAGAALGASALATGADGAPTAEAKDDDKKVIWRNKKPGMDYRRLGRTDYMCSRLAVGWRGDNRLRQILFGKGVNYIDTSRAYPNNEQEISPVVKKYRDRIFLSSKASGVAGYPRLSFKPGEGAKAARMYNELLDTSLKTLKVDHLDCYYLHGVSQPWVLETEELYAAFEKARQAGKVLHNGFTTHSGVAKVLAKAVEVEDKGQIKYDLIMMACKPRSWPELKDVVTELRKRDIGLICMKGVGNVAGPQEGRVGQVLKLADELKLNRAERSYAYMLHVADFDVLISEMQSIEHVEGNLKLPGMRLTASARQRLETIVMAEQQGACHHCGRCAGACPEMIEVDDVLRYYSYYHHYGHRPDACAAMEGLGYDVARACTECGRCVEVCPEGIDLPRVIKEMAGHLA